MLKIAVFCLLFLALAQCKSTPRHARSRRQAGNSLESDSTNFRPAAVRPIPQPLPIQIIPVQTRPRSPPVQQFPVVQQQVFPVQQQRFPVSANGQGVQPQGLQSRAGRNGLMTPVEIYTLPGQTSFKLIPSGSEPA